MTGRSFSVLALPVVAVLIGLVTIGLLFLGRFLNLGIYTLLLLAVPIALAVAYLVWYSRLPYEPWRPPATIAAPVAAAPEEPFEDPVEEADRLETESKVTSTATAPEPESEGIADEAAEPE